MQTKVPLSRVNGMTRDEFVAAFGGIFEHSPWVAERAWAGRPFESIDALHRAMTGVVAGAAEGERLSLIRAHPDLVGKLAREGRLTAASAREQAAAGLAALSPEEVARFEEFNARYWQAFDFPFIICARENKKDAILGAFPVRLKNSRATEIATALGEIGKIARHRLLDRVG